MELIDFLKEKHVEFQLCAHRPTFTSQQMAAEEHTPGINVAKPVIIQADRVSQSWMLVRVVDEARLAGAPKVSVATSQPKG